MATLDVADILDDPEFQSTAQLVRIDQAVGSNGRLVSTPQAAVNITGCIQPAGNQEYQLFPELGRVTGTLSFYTKAALRGKGATHAPDQILWQGQTYIVMGANDWGNYGQGYIMAMLQLKDLLEVP